MITKEGYSKDASLLPDGICVTWGKDMIAQCGGWRKFYRHFLNVINNEDCIWNQKSRGKPSMEIMYVYIIVNNRVRYRLNYLGFERFDTVLQDGNGDKYIDWSRITMTGPLVKAPTKIIRKGFQGFRYCQKLF